MSIQVFVPKFRTEECLAEIKECLDKGWTGIGYKTHLFEEKWREYTGLPFAHFISSNTVGLHMAFNLFKAHDGWQDGDEVITTPLTFVSTNHAILYEKLQPVFADVDDSLCLDPASIEQKITPKTRAVIFVGLGGNVGKLHDVSALCKRYGLRLILDAAHMSGTRYHGKHVGHEADVSIFSFQAVKNLPTADSGMICFQDSLLDEQARRLSWLGINKDTYARTNKGNYKWKYDVDQLGYKYHGNSIMASLGLVGLKYLDADNAYRRRLARLYYERLSENPNIRFIDQMPHCETSQHLFQIRVQDRDQLIDHLQEHDIYPGVHYRDNTEYRMYEFASNTCKNACLVSNELISLPLHLHLVDDDIENICAIINVHFMALA